MAEIRFEFGRDLAAPKEAREVVSSLLLDVDPIGDDVLLVVSELVTNAVIHTSSGGVLRAVDPHPDVPFRIEVSDSNPNPPAMRVAQADHLGGRGLAIIDHLCDAWGVEPLVDGKLVWAVFDRRRRARP